MRSGRPHPLRWALSRELVRAWLRSFRTSRSALYFRFRNRFSTDSVTGDAPVTVSLTSYGDRIRAVHLAVESMACGRVRPRRLILWLDDVAVVADPPPPLARLVRRGLEIRATEDWGPHKKYYPYVRSLDRHELPLVIADDDVLYGETWLEELLAVHERHPCDVVAHRAHSIRLEAGRIMPYATWTPGARAGASFRTFATGTSGVLYPAHLLDALREAGTGFAACAPRADDVWLHAVALRHGARTRPVTDGHTAYRPIPRTLFGGLRTTNVLRGGNDMQIAATYSAPDVRKLWQAQVTEGP
ncbi:hypothetical protein ACH9EU_01765 [Kocuria sp. M1R5S2]|uniref:hypothetical protein n=1 Tax=Kocuria rhizosphaerae TaxID=3376285 RepID=UPI0037A4037C